MSVNPLLLSSPQLQGSDVDTDPKANASFTELLEVLTLFLIFYSFSNSYSVSSLIWVKSFVLLALSYTYASDFHEISLDLHWYSLYKSLAFCSFFLAKNYSKDCILASLWFCHGLVLLHNIKQIMIPKPTGFQYRTHVTDKTKKDPLYYHILGYIALHSWFHIPFFYKLLGTSLQKTALAFRWMLVIMGWHSGA